MLTIIQKPYVTNHINRYSKTNNFYPVYSYGLKNDTISFTSKSLYDKTSDEITTEVKESVLNTEKIGFGSEGNVYMLPDKKYCVKIFKGESLNNFGKWNFNVSEQDKINHVIAKAENGAVIMRRIEGKSLNWEKTDDLYDLPKEAYKNLVIQISKAFDECLKFDNAPSNVIYNKEKQTLTAIDFYEPSPDVDYNFSPLSAVFSVLQSHSRTPSDIQNNNKLAGNLLEIVLDEITSDKKSEYTPDRRDVFQMLGELHMAQNYQEPKQMFFLRDSLSEIFRLQNKTLTDDEERKFNGNVKVVKAIIKQVLLND